jgi:peptide/nickel transport system permease protein
MDHLLGADQLGRDIFSRILHGGRVSLLSVVVAVAAFVSVGVTFGLIAGYLGGWVDRALMRICDVMMAIPIVITVLIVLAIFGRNPSAAMLAFGLLASAGLVRIVRAVTLTVRSDDYVQAAVIAGLTSPQIIRRHILPRVSGPLLIQTALLAGSALLVESGLNYLGLGVQPPTPSWGGLVTEASRAITSHPWLLVPSGGIIITTAFAFALIGDTARDAVADRSELAPSSWRHMVTRVESLSPRVSDGQGDTPDADLLRLRGLEVRAGDVVLVRDLDLRVGPGEIVGLVGESGCGKSITLSALLRLLPAGVTMAAEEYHLGGENLLAMSERQMARRRGSAIGFIPQEPVAGLDPSFTVATQLTELARHHLGVGRAEARQRVHELLELVRLPDPDRVLASYPHQLSGGMAQRVAIARALVGSPRLLVADEPTTALDVTVQAEILDLLRSLRESAGVSVVIVTHDWGVVADVCDRAVVMYGGEIMERGDVRELFHRPRHPYTRALLAANPSSARFREKLQAIPGAVMQPANRPTGCCFAARCFHRGDDCVSSSVELTVAADEHAYRCRHPYLPLREASDVAAR